MTSPDEQPGGSGNPEDEDEEEFASTPFDNPFFLPIVLAGFSLWMLYDGYLNTEFIESHEGFDLAFNQWGGPILGVLALWFTSRAFRERRQESQPDPDSARD